MRIHVRVDQCVSDDRWRRQNLSASKKPLTTYMDLEVHKVTEKNFESLFLKMKGTLWM